MNDTKSITKSGTAWGASLLAIVSLIFGVDFSDLDLEEVSKAFVTILTLVFTLWRRMVATGPARLPRIGGGKINLLALTLSLGLLAATGLQTGCAQLAGLKTTHPGAYAIGRGAAQVALLLAVDSLAGKSPEIAENRDLLRQVVALGFDEARSPEETARLINQGAGQLFEDTEIRRIIAETFAATLREGDGLPAAGPDRRFSLALADALSA